MILTAICRSYCAIYRRVRDKDVNYVAYSKKSRPYCVIVYD